MILDFLEELAAEPCGKTVPDAFCATVSFMENAAGIPRRKGFQSMLQYKEALLRSPANSSRERRPPESTTTASTFDNSA